MSSLPPPIDRRDFLHRLAAGGLVFAISVTGCHRLADDGGHGSAGAPAPGAPGGMPEPFSPAVYLRIDQAGGVTVIAHRSEMGQGIRSTFAMIVADELDADWARVGVEQAPGDEHAYGPQSTDGSHSIRDFFLPLRQAGATARTMLEAAAARQWGVSAREVRAEHHAVVHAPSGRRLDYAALVAVAKSLPVPAKETLRLKSPSEFRYIGKAIPSLDLFDMTVGRARYGIDQHMDGMLVAVVARPPVYGGTIAQADMTAAEAVPGVVRVVRLDHTPPPSGMAPAGGIAVVARNTWAAISGREALAVTWRDGANGNYDSAVYRAALERAVHRPGKVARHQGDVAAALGRAERRVEATYYVPHLAHAPMEPPNALALVTDGRCEVWAPTQDPQNARDELAKALGLSTDAVRVNVTLLGGAFGRKSFPDFIIEAALLSRVVGAPVKVVWTREDDLQHDFYHSVAAEHLEAGLDTTGRVTAWLHRSALPPEDSQSTPHLVYQTDDEVGQGMTDLPYAIPNLRAEACPAPAHTRIGWYRSVINIPHAFAIASFVDELAHAAGRDPKEFILELLGPDRIVDMSHAGVTGKLWNYDATFDEYPIDIARYRGVVDRVARESAWGQPLPAGEGRGIAVHRSYLSYAATVVHARVASDGTLTIPRADVALDAGFIANPDRVRAQLEGATIMGLSNALYGEISFKRGRAEQSNFDSYRVTRMDMAPRVLGVHVVASEAKPAGVGEPGVPPFAPALCNAIFAATGTRIRRLPVGDQLARRKGAVV